PVDLVATATDAWETADTRRGTLETAVDGGDVLADEERLRQLLENLFRNAAEHGGDDATVTVGSLADGSGFYVADDGPGIPEAEREQVFETGYTTTADGTGFGLNIVGEIVDAHGWEIRVVESEDGGARFEITGVESA
ncbi:sensor histidine kinase, partial [Halorubrum ezzemoulense]|uniref:sensor histidine kinase n=2 Tax=Halorubrum TaxID=56688 RepID=UPI00232C3EE4